MMGYGHVTDQVFGGRGLPKSKGWHNAIDLILGDLLQSVFFVVSAPDNIVQSRLVSVTKMAGF